jgi:CDP-glycerol glycerophosphotransferase (TagB/SpsB family)
VKLVHERDIVLLMKFHPLTRPEWLETYRQLANQEEHIVFVDDFSVTKYMLMSDLMISDTSSTVYEFLLLNKPVVTLNTIAKDIYWKNISCPEELTDAYDAALYAPEMEALRRWVVENYDPYLDGQVAHRMLEGARDYIRRHGVPHKRKLNLWRKYTSIKTFGRIRRS